MSLKPANAEFFSNDMKRYEKLLNRRLLRDLDGGFEEWVNQNQRVDRRKDRHLGTAARKRRRQELRKTRDRRTNNGDREALTFLRQEVAANLTALYRLVEYQETLRRSLSTTDDKESRQEILLDHAQILGSTPSQISEDREAFKRWFDEDAILDRYQRQQGELQQRLAFRINRLGKLLASIASQHGTAGCDGVWRRLHIDDLMLDLLNFPGDSRIDVEAAKCYRRCLEQLPAESESHFVSEKTRAKLYELATGPQFDVWLQCEAISSIWYLEGEAFLPEICKRLEKYQTAAVKTKQAGVADELSAEAKKISRDDIFVRRHIVRELIARGDDTSAWPLLLSVTQDESVFVRQQLAKDLWHLPVKVAGPLLRHFLLHEPQPQVVAAALASAVENVSSTGLHADWLRLLSACLQQRDDTFVLRTALFAATQWLAVDGELPNKPSVIAAYQDSILPAIKRLESCHESTPVRRWAAHAYEKIACCLDPSARDMLLTLADFVNGMQPGDIRRMPSGISNNATPESLGRLLAILAQDDYGFDIHYGWTGCWLARQPIFGNRLWRIIHELRNPATDKRQAFSHTIGRVTRATIRVPSQIMGELSRTKVPGEPFFIPSEGSWRPYLPLADDFVSLLNLSIVRSQTMRFFTSQGETQVSAPSSLWRRLRAWSVLTWNFEKFANRRDWEEGDDESPATYLEQFRKLGFEIEIRPYEDASPRQNTTDDSHPEVPDDSVVKYFGSFGLMPALGIPSLEYLQGLVQRYSTYFYSVYDNTLQQLLLFSVLFAAFFIGRHMLANWKLRKARRRIPLFLGGWGTRGKSGTERLKAALVGALGYGMVSKTTGCEAMFIHNDPFGDPLEIPLYRPYDKATIWEQSNVIQMADRMDASVFLWECMGLNPTYVDILQRQWSRDDLSTVTNLSLIHI